MLLLPLACSPRPPLTCPMPLMSPAGIEGCSGTSQHRGHGAGGASTYWRHKCAPRDALTRHLLPSTPKNAPLGLLSSLGVSVGDPHLWVWGSGVPSVGMECGHPAATSNGAPRGIGTAGGKDKEHVWGDLRGAAHCQASLQLHCLPDKAGGCKGG